MAYGLDGLEDLLNPKPKGGSAQPWTFPTDSEPSSTTQTTFPDPVVPPVTPPPTTPLPGSVTPPVTVTPPTNTAWKTDGFAQPKYTAPKYGQTLNGWDAVKWSNPNHQTPKYVVGRILSNYPDNVGGLTAAMGDIQKAYPGATILDGGRSGKISIPGVGVVDVGVAFGAGGGHGWAWQAEGAPQGGTATTGTTTSANGVPNTATDPTLSLQQQIQALIAKFSQTTAPQNVTSGTTFTQAPQGTVMPTGKPAADGSTTWTVGAPVPGMNGFVYNSVGGYEPGGAGNAVPGMPGATYGEDGYSVVNPNQPITLEQALQQAFSAAPSTSTTATNTGTSGSSSTGASSSGVPPSNGFTDPATATLDELIRKRIAQLNAPIDDPTQTQAAGAIQNQISHLSTPLTTPDQTQTFQQVMADVIAKLQGPTFSDPELDAMRTRAFDALNRQEQAEIANTTRTLADHGVPPSSGLVQHAIQKVRDKFSELKALQQQQLNQYAIDVAGQRRAQLLQTAQTGSNVALTQQQTDEQRKAQVVSLAQQLVEMARASRGEASNNANQAISFAGVPVDITERRVANAANLGQGGTAQAGSIVNTLNNLIQGFNQQSGQNQQNSSTYWQNLIAYLANIDWSKVFK